MPADTSDTETKACVDDVAGRMPWYPREWKGDISTTKNLHADSSGQSQISALIFLRRNAFFCAAISYFPRCAARNSIVTAAHGHSKSVSENRREVGEPVESVGVVAGNSSPICLIWRITAEGILQLNRISSM
jgi:hypothetical protein